MESTMNEPQLTPRKEWRDLELQKWYNITQVWTLTGENGEVNLFFQLDRSFYVLFPSYTTDPGTIDSMVKLISEAVKKIKLYIYRNTISDMCFKIRIYKKIQ